MKNNYTQSQSSIDVFGQIINFNFAGNLSGINASTIVDVGASNLGSRSRIRSGRISSSDSTALLVKSFEFTGMNGAMLGSGRSSSSPTLCDSMVAGDVENKFGVNFTDVVPVQNSSRKRISNSQTNISEKQSWSLNSKVDGCCNQKCECTESDVLDLGVRGIQNRREEHSKTEDVSHGAIDSRALRTKNNGIATSASQNGEW